MLLAVLLMSTASGIGAAASRPADAIESSSPSTWSVMFATAHAPWAWGPYQQQLAMLALSQTSLGCSVYWMVMGLADKPPQVERAFESPAAFADYFGAIVPTEEQSEAFRGVHFLVHSHPRSGSAINQVTGLHSIDAVIMLGDSDSFFPDTPLVAPISIYWFPNHFQTFDPRTRAVLAHFTHIVALSPSDAARLRADSQTSRGQNITFIPHAVSMPNELLQSARHPSDAAEGGADAPAAGPSKRLPPPPANRTALREALGVPTDAFVVLVHSGNYESQNRKSFDTSVLAFEAFRKRVPSAFLYLHVLSAMGINAAHTRDGAPASVGDLGVSLDALLYLAGPPEESYLWDDRVLPYADALRLLQMADVLLVPSKTEGFCMPILEAQLLGTPVVSTRFGAMADFTRHGVAVEPLAQPHWMSRGFVASPDLAAVIDALSDVHRGLYDGEREAAQAWVAETMNAEVVAAQFAELIRDALLSPPPRPRGSAAVLPPRPHRFASSGVTGAASPLPPDRTLGTAGGGSPVDGSYVEVFYETWDLSRWIPPMAPMLLIQSDRFVVSPEAVRVAITQAPKADVLFLQSQRTSGQIFPMADDVQRGNLSPDATLLIRTQAIMRVASEPAARSMHLSQLVMETLSRAQSLKLNMRHIAARIVAHEKAFAGHAEPDGEGVESRARRARRRGASTKNEL